MTKLILVVSLLAAACSSPAPSNRAIDFAKRLDHDVSCDDWGTHRGPEDADSALCLSSSVLHWCHASAAARPGCDPLADLHPQPVKPTPAPAAPVPSAAAPAPAAAAAAPLPPTPQFTPAVIAPTPATAPTAPSSPPTPPHP